MARRALITGITGQDGSKAVAATVSWYEALRAGRDARAVTLTQIEERS